MQNILNNVKNTSNPYYHELIYLQLDFSFKTSSRIFFSDTLYKDLIEHLYKFTITISSKVNENGIAVDFFIFGIYMIIIYLKRLTLISSI